MPEMLFEFVSHRMMPVLPASDRIADNSRYFTSRGAAERIGCTAEELAAEWLCYFSADQSELPPEVVVEDRPVVTSEDDPFASAIQSARFNILRIVRFPHLSPEHWQYVVSDCARRRLDPSLVWVKIEINDHGVPMPVIISTIAAFRLIAERSGRRNGETPPQWCGRDGIWKDIWTDAEQPPYAARVAVLKKGIDQPYEGIAYWRTHAQYRLGPDGLPVLEKMWDIGGPFMLAKCAAAIGYREGWPDEFSNLYTSDEIRRPRLEAETLTVPLKSNGPGVPTVEISDVAMPTARFPMMAFPDDPSFAWRLVDETTPENVARLELELMEAGVTPRAQAAAVVGRFRQMLPRLFGGHLKAFCAAVLKCVRENPAAYDLPGL